MAVTDYVMNINSYQDRRVGDYCHDWVTYFSDPIRVQQGRITVCVSQIEIPNTFYNFNASSSYFWYELGGVLQPAVQIDTDRNYATPDELKTELNTKLVGAGIVLSYSSTTGKFTITNGNVADFRLVGSYRWSDSLATTYGNIADRIGFTQDTALLTLANGQTLEGEGVARMLRTSCIYLTLKEKEFTAMQVQSRVPTPYMSPYILARVPAGNWGTMSQWATSDEIFFSTNNKELKKLSFEILDENLETLELNECPVCFQLHIKLE